MTIEDWLASACADADRRGLADLKPLLASLAEATAELRRAGWDDGNRAGEASDTGVPAPSGGAPDEGASR